LFFFLSLPTTTTTIAQAELIIQLAPSKWAGGELLCAGWPVGKKVI
jgi:hypothetical protein